MSDNPYSSTESTDLRGPQVDRSKKIRNISGITFILSLIILRLFAFLVSKQFEKWSTDGKSNLILTDSVKREIYIYGAIVVILGLTVVISALITLTMTIKVALRKKAPTP